MDYRYKGVMQEHYVIGFSTGGEGELFLLEMTEMSFTNDFWLAEHYYSDDGLKIAVERVMAHDPYQTAIIYGCSEYGAPYKAIHIKDYINGGMWANFD